MYNPFSSLAFRLLFQFIIILGIKNKSTKKTAGNTIYWYSMLTINLGSPMPTWKELAPSGFPNLTQFSFF
jgi:hypothetical protein